MKTKNELPKVEFTFEGSTYNRYCVMGNKVIDAKTLKHHRCVRSGVKAGWYWLKDTKGKSHKVPEAFIKEVSERNSTVDYEQVSEGNTVKWYESLYKVGCYVVDGAVLLVTVTGLVYFTLLGA